MRVRDRVTRLVLLVELVVRETEEGLDPEEGKDDDAEDRVCSAGVLEEIISHVSQFYTKHESRDQQAQS